MTKHNENKMLVSDEANAMRSAAQLLEELGWGEKGRNGYFSLEQLIEVAHFLLNRGEDLDEDSD